MTNVPGPVFLAFYAVLIAICVVLLIVGRVTSGGPLRKTPNVLELAYASGGRMSLVATVVALLDPPQRLEHLERHGSPDLYRNISTHPIIGRIRQLMEASDLQHLPISKRAEEDHQLKELEKTLPQTCATTGYCQTTRRSCVDWPAGSRLQCFYSGFTAS
ncbi:hypothetical protein HMPREF0183_1924 [Brevibacterium mcbrellneri ATCC 49030]|uniref:Uncharacterized protein n=2 Tax=Brevibacterium TaxID=1696 RepID=D4YPR4_9MICO|nr:hypothetical protein HMPREF0183_1924 [Brevibacterium mcbrellneri ATCC 49030]